MSHFKDFYGERGGMMAKEKSQTNKKKSKGVEQKKAKNPGWTRAETLSAQMESGAFVFLAL